MIKLPSFHCTRLWGTAMSTWARNELTWMGALGPMSWKRLRWPPRRCVLLRIEILRRKQGVSGRKALDERASRERWGEQGPQTLWPLLGGEGGNKAEGPSSGLRDEVQSEKRSVETAQPSFLSAKRGAVQAVCSLDDIWASAVILPPVLGDPVKEVGDERHHGLRPGVDIRGGRTRRRCSIEEVRGLAAANFPNKIKWVDEVFRRKCSP